MIGYGDDAKMMELLAPLRRLEPVPFALPDRVERRRLRSPVLVAAIVVVALALTGVAIADGVGAFRGISAVQRPQTPADRLDLAAEINAENYGRLASDQLLPDSARLVKQLPDGIRIFAVATNGGELCALAERLPNNNGKNDASAMGCGSPLTQDQPTTAASFRANDETPTISWGITLDNVTAVSFMASGQGVTVPVVNNVWAYEGDNGGLESLTVHYADGTTSVLSH
ncbi:MAG: hypothetical protein ACJ75G_04015 [Gaiellaceae bacterium]